VAELREMSNLEFLGWQAYYALEASELELEQRKARGEGRVSRA
jgi:hypothetical protein